MVRFVDNSVYIYWPAGPQLLTVIGPSDIDCWVEWLFKLWYFAIHRPQWMILSLSLGEKAAGEENIFKFETISRLHWMKVTFSWSESFTNIFKFETRSMINWFNSLKANPSGRVMIGEIMLYNVPYRISLLWSDVEMYLWHRKDVYDVHSPGIHQVLIATQGRKGTLQ